MAQNDTSNEVGSLHPSAEGASLAPQGDAPRPSSEEAQLRRELDTLRSELRTAGRAYQALNAEIEKIKADHNGSVNQQSYGKSPPLTKVNGRKAEFLRTWFDMIPTHLRVSGIDPETPRAVLYVAAHFEFPLSKWFVGQQKRNNDDTGGFSKLSELRAACLEFHRERDPEKTARDALKTVTQRGTVLQFAHRLEEIFLSLPEHPESYKIHDFTFGLKPHIREAVQLAEPTTFTQAVRIAQEKENASSDRGPQPMELGQLQTTPYRVIKGPLTAAKKDALRKTNACFYCRKQGHSIADCPETKKTKSGN